MYRTGVLDPQRDDVWRAPYPATTCAESLEILRTRCAAPSNDPTTAARVAKLRSTSASSSAQ